MRLEERETTVNNTDAAMEAVELQQRQLAVLEAIEDLLHEIAISQRVLIARISGEPEWKKAFPCATKIELPEEKK